MKHVVVIDRDHEMRGLIAGYLSQHAFRVSAFGEIDEVGQIMTTEVVDVVIIDPEPDDVDGPHEMIKEVTLLAGAPIIIISGARIDEADKVRALELGASDYITKPLGMRELLARVRVATREKRLAKIELQRRAYRFNDLTLFVKQRVLRRPAFEDIRLPSAEFNLLAAFLKLPRRVLTRERLVTETRLNGGEIFDRSVDVLVLRLRRKIEEDPSNPMLIKTQRGAGYILDADVSVIERTLPLRCKPSAR